MSTTFEFISPPVLPRSRQPPRRYNSGTQEYTHPSPKELYRQQYYEVIDLLVNEMDRRFDQETFSILQEMETLLIESCNGMKPTPSSRFSSIDNDDFDIDRLSHQLEMLQDLVTTANEDFDMGLKEVTSIDTICEIFNICSFAKKMMSEVHRLLSLYLTIPMTSATAERSLSALRRLKSYLRTTMTQQCLNHVIMTHVHQERTDQLDLKKIAQEFAKKNSRRIDFFGLFE